MMIMNTRAIIGVLFTPGLFEEEVDPIITGSSGGHRQTREEEEAKESKERKEEEEKAVRGKEMEKGEQEGRKKEWKSPSGVDGEISQSL